MIIIKNISDNSLSVELDGSRDSINNIENICKEIGERWTIASKDIFTINLVLEELISNTIFYGFIDEDNKYIIINLTIEKEFVIIQITDNAIPFNPLDVNSKPNNIELEKMEVGGLGIHLVKNMVRSIEYKNIDGENRLKVEIDVSKLKST